MSTSAHNGEASSAAEERGPAQPQGEWVEKRSASSDLPMDPKLCRLCLMAAVIFAFGKEAALLI